MNCVEYKEYKKSYGVSAVKCHLMFAFNFLKIRFILIGLAGMRYIPVIVVGN
jgi:hypothetical protein